MPNCTAQYFSVNENSTDRNDLIQSSRTFRYNHFVTAYPIKQLNESDCVQKVAAVVNIVKKVQSHKIRRISWLATEILVSQ
jgi:hypothetical protein